MCYVLIYTLQGLKADVVYFMDMSQHKMLALVKWTIWLDNYLTIAWKTTNHMNGYLITVMYYMTYWAQTGFMYSYMK